jgi:hypothetical protein
MQRVHAAVCVPPERYMLVVGSYERLPSPRISWSHPFLSRTRVSWALLLRLTSMMILHTLLASYGIGSSGLTQMACYQRENHMYSNSHPTSDRPADPNQCNGEGSLMSGFV